MNDEEGRVQPHQVNAPQQLNVMPEAPDQLVWVKSEHYTLGTMLVAQTPEGDYTITYGAYGTTGAIMKTPSGRKIAYNFTSDIETCIENIKQSTQVSHTMKMKNARAMAAPKENEWEVEPNSRMDGFECLIWWEGRWRHVKWSSAQKAWHLQMGGGYVDPVMFFAKLPDNTPPRTDGNRFYDWNV